MTAPKIAIVMGSQSDWPTMKHAADILDSLEIPYFKQIVSAHRTPDLLFQFAETAEGKGFQAIIAGAGGAAHLPGMIAAKTHLPVLGVPVKSRSLNGLDSLSIVQMPKGIPVATLAIGEAGASNAALLAASILSSQDEKVRQNLLNYRKNQTDAVLKDPHPGEMS